MRDAGRRIDRAWPATIVVVGGALSLAVSARSTRGWDRVDLIGRLSPTTRAIFYGSLATSAGALLGLTIASIAILLTLDPARDEVKDMQSLDAWSILNMTLLTGAGCLALVLLFATIALGADDRTAGAGPLESAVAALAVVAFAELAVGGAAFAIVVRKVTGREA